MRANGCRRGPDLSRNKSAYYIRTHALTRTFCSFYIRGKISQNVKFLSRPAAVPRTTPHNGRANPPTADLTPLASVIGAVVVDDLFQRSVAIEYLHLLHASQ